MAGRGAAAGPGEVLYACNLSSASRDAALDGLLGAGLLEEVGEPLRAGSRRPVAATPAGRRALEALRAGSLAATATTRGAT